MIKWLETLKLKLSNKQENCDSKKSSIKNSKQCCSNSGDRNIVAGGDIYLTKETTNAMQYKKAWDNLAAPLSSNRISWMIKNIFQYPGYVHSKKEDIQKWKNDIKNAAEKVPVVHLDAREENLIKIVKEALEAIDSYVEHPNEKELRKKFTSLFNSVSEIRYL